MTRRVTPRVTPRTGIDSARLATLHVRLKDEQPGKWDIGWPEAVALTMALLFIVVLWLVPPPPLVAKCPEDATLVGMGAFQDGHYERYVCGPAVDDYAPGTVPDWQP